MTQRPIATTAEVALPGLAAAVAISESVASEIATSEPAAVVAAASEP